MNKENATLNMKKRLMFSQRIFFLFVITGGILQLFVNILQAKD